MSKLDEIMNDIFKNGLEFEVYDHLHPLIIKRYKNLKYENSCIKSLMRIARKLNKNKNKEIDIVLDEEGLYD